MSPLLPSFVLQYEPLLEKNLILFRCFNVTDVVSTLCNVENLGSEFVSFSTSDQPYFNVDLQRWNTVCERLLLKISTSMTNLPKWGNSWRWYRFQYRKLLSHRQRTIRFFKNSTYQNTDQKEKCSCNLYIVRNEEFEFIWQKLYLRERQTPYSTWRKLT